MNPYRKAATRVHNIKCKLRNIEYADRGVERYVKMYKDPARRARYKAQFEEELKELGEPKFIPLQTKRTSGGRKKGGKNRFYCSDGERVTQAQIDARRSLAYRTAYQGNLLVRCEGCGEKATESSHIISQKRAKDMHATNLIWNPENFFASCRSCHTKWEATFSGQWLDLLCVQRCLETLKKYDNEGYEKRTSVNGDINSKH
jgi:5-methylcytosine-specific restriction endonuclease McrA